VIEYPLSRPVDVLILADPVLEHFVQHRQRFYQREAGGQLFSRLCEGQLLIERATGPRRSDRRTRFSFVPDRPEEQVEILALHEQGLHYVGDWHTHPQRAPRPSAEDLRSIGDCFRRSQHKLDAFVLIIVGQLDPPAGLHVSVNTAEEHTTLVAKRER
jgi:integrative and conjugative element protein (TIGR02256 family)